MPMYTLYNEETEEEYDVLMKYEDKKSFLEAHPFIQERIGAPAFVKGVGDRTKPPEGFKEVLSKISEANPNSKLAGDYGRKDHKSVKIRELVQKHSAKATGD
tara:strand:- start:201 stop:506 length:306 start_codon:yes stop_codon:yes gene_type:complete